MSWWKRTAQASHRVREAMDGGYIGRMMLKMELPGRRKEERQQKRLTDVLQSVGVTEENRAVVRRSQMIHCGDRCTRSF